jgi:hypothetical protein
MIKAGESGTRSTMREVSGPWGESSLDLLRCILPRSLFRLYLVTTKSAPASGAKGLTPKSPGVLQVGSPCDVGTRGIHHVAKPRWRST